MKQLDLQKLQFASGMMDIAHNPELYYVSSIDTKYNKLTDVGVAEVSRYVQHWLPYLLQCEVRALDQRAQQLVVEALQK